MLFIHGGAYQGGSPEWFGPDYLLNQNVIVVSDILLVNCCSITKTKISIIGHMCL